MIQILTFGEIGIASGAGTSWVDLLNGDGAQGSEFQLAVWSAAGVLRNFKPRLSVAPGSGNSITLTVRKGTATSMADTAMSVTISGANTTGTYTGDLAIADGDVVSLKVVRTGSTPSTELGYTLEFDGATTGQSAYGAYCSSLGGGAGSRFTGAFSMFSWPQGDTLEERETPCPAAGAITKLNILQRYNFGSFGWTGPVTFHLYKNGVKQDGTGGTVDTGITCDHPDNNTVKSRSFTLSVVPGDRVAIGADVADTSPASFEPGIQFTATTDGQAILAGGQLEMPGAGTTYTRLTDRNAAWGVSDVQLVDGAVTPFTLKNLYLATSAPPGAGDSWTASLRLNQASPAGTPTATVDGSETIDGDLVNTFAVTSADRVSLRLVGVGSPASAIGAWAMVVETAGDEEPEPEPPAPGATMPRGCWYCRPSEDLVNRAILAADSIGAGSDVATLQENDPATRFVAAGTSLEVELTLPEAYAPVLAFVCNSNATSAAIVADGGAFNVAIPMPPRTIGGHVRNGSVFLGGVRVTPDAENVQYTHFVGLPENADTVFRFVLSKGGSAPIEVGRLVLVLVLREMPFSSGPGAPALSISVERPGAVRNRTRLGSRGRRRSPVAPMVTLGGVLEPMEYVEDAQILEEEVHGVRDGAGFFFLANPGLDDPLFATMPDGLRWREGEVAGRLEVSIEELARGYSPPE